VRREEVALDHKGGDAENCKGGNPSFLLGGTSCDRNSSVRTPYGTTGGGGIMREIDIIFFGGPLQRV